jgi:glycosyltransferase involved in cell wall biosynthesis
MSSNTQTLRVAVLTTVPQTIAAFFEQQLRDLAAVGFEVHVISSPGSDLDSIAPGAPLQKHGIAMERQPHPLRDLKSLWTLCAAIRRIRPHVVHAHTPKAGLLGMLAAKLSGVPVRLYTVHGLPLETRSGRLRQILEWAERLSAFCSTRTYSVSNSVRERVIELGLCPASKVQILGHGSCSGVNVERFQVADRAKHSDRLRQQLKIPADAPIGTFIGRLSRDKGIQVLADAWPELSRMVPSLHLVIAGEMDHTDPVSPEAIQILENHPKIHLLGSVQAKEVPELYAASDFVVLPSFREGLSQVALETGAAGLPIVASRVWGLVDPIVDGLTGILVPPRDPHALALAMARLANDQALRLQMGAAAQNFVSTHFADRRVNQLWIGEYQRLVQESFPQFRASTIGAEV